MAQIENPLCRFGETRSSPVSNKKAKPSGFAFLLALLTE
jgi:hypothetical protein